MPSSRLASLIIGVGSCYLIFFSMQMPLLWILFWERERKDLILLSDQLPIINQLLLQSWWNLNLNEFLCRYIFLLQINKFKLHQSISKTTLTRNWNENQLKRCPRKNHITRYVRGSEELAKQRTQPYSEDKNTPAFEPPNQS